jgi:hypothetical protein
MRLKVPYKSLQHTLQQLKKQVEDSLPFISNYIPSDIKSPEELFYFLKDKITYKKDPKGVELLQSVQTLFDNNQHGKSGYGDCDCFTILTLAACEYLGFTPVQVVLVGRSPFKPSHIYSNVWDKSKKKYCVFDLTNPYYCMERKYNYKQTLDFMILELADNFFNDLAGKAQRQAKKAAKQAAKVVKKQQKAQRKVVRQTAKTARKTAKQEGRTKRKFVKQEAKTAKKAAKATRKILRTDRRTDRVAQKGERKAVKRAVKVEKKKTKMLRVGGRQDVIKAKTKSKLDNILNPQLPTPMPGGGGGGGYAPSDYEPEEYSMTPDENDYDAFYTPEMPNDEDYPGSEYDASDAEYDTYEEVPEDEYYQEEIQELSMPALVPLIKAGAKKLLTKVTQGKAAQTLRPVTQRVSGEIEYRKKLEAERADLRAKVDQYSNQRYYYGAGGLGIGLLTGVLLGKSIK